jgi:ankyrin repeat protein
MGATVEGRLESVKLLLELGAQVDAENDKGQTALVMASGPGHTEIREALLKYGAEE